MEKFIVKSSLHDNKELVVLQDLKLAKAGIQGFINKKKEGIYSSIPDRHLYRIEGVEDSYILDKDVLSASTKPIVFSQKEALGMIKQERDKLELGLISQEEYEKRKADWAKYIK